MISIRTKPTRGGCYRVNDLSRPRETRWYRGLTCLIIWTFGSIQVAVSREVVLRHKSPVLFNRCKEMDLRRAADASDATAKVESQTGTDPSQSRPLSSIPVYE